MLKPILVAAAVAVVLVAPGAGRAGVELLPPACIGVSSEEAALNCISIVENSSSIPPADKEVVLTAVKMAARQQGWNGAVYRSTFVLNTLQTDDSGVVQNPPPTAADMPAAITTTPPTARPAFDMDKLVKSLEEDDEAQAAGEAQGQEKQSQEAQNSPAPAEAARTDDPCDHLFYPSGSLELSNAKHCMDGLVASGKSTDAEFDVLARIAAETPKDQQFDEALSIGWRAVEMGKSLDEKNWKSAAIEAAFFATAVNYQSERSIARVTGIPPGAIGSDGQPTKDPYYAIAYNRIEYAVQHSGGNMPTQYHFIAGYAYSNVSWNNPSAKAKSEEHYRIANEMQSRENAEAAAQAIATDPCAAAQKGVRGADEVCAAKQQAEAEARLAAAKAQCTPLSVEGGPWFSGFGTAVKNRVTQVERWGRFSDQAAGVVCVTKATFLEEHTNPFGGGKFASVRMEYINRNNELRAVEDDIPY